MRHEIVYDVGAWKGGAMVWDDDAGTLEWTRDPDEPPSATDRVFMQELPDLVDRARREGRIVIQWSPDPRRWVLEDAAHDPADFLRLMGEHGCDGTVPPSLRDVEATPHEPLPPRPPGSTELDGPWEPATALR